MRFSNSALSCPNDQIGYAWLLSTERCGRRAARSPNRQGQLNWAEEACSLEGVLLALDRQPSMPTVEAIPLRSELSFLKMVGLSTTMAAWLVSGSFAAEQTLDVPAWLRDHIGEGEGQIAQVVLRRGRDLYLRKVKEGVVKNPCYFAMDATRPHNLGDGRSGARFYVVLRSGSVFSCDFRGSRQRPRFEGCRRFPERKRVRKELWQCDGFIPDGRRRLCDG